MLGKTFKGMTDEMLAWQTERFLELASDHRDTYVVERAAASRWWRSRSTALQRSTRYPGGVALRFARVVRYRDDKGRPRGRHDRDGPLARHRVSGPPQPRGFARRQPATSRSNVRPASRQPSNQDVCCP